MWREQYVFFLPSKKEKELKYFWTCVNYQITKNMIGLQWSLYPPIPAVIWYQTGTYGMKTEWVLIKFYMTLLYITISSLPYATDISFVINLTFFPLTWTYSWLNPFDTSLLINPLERIYIIYTVNFSLCFFLKILFLTSPNSGNLFGCSEEQVPYN